MAYAGTGKRIQMDELLAKQQEMKSEASNGPTSVSFNDVDAKFVHLLSGKQVRSPKQGIRLPNAESEIPK